VLKNLKVSHCEGAKRLKQSVTCWQQTDRLLHPAIAGFAMTGMRLFQQAQQMRWGTHVDNYLMLEYADNSL